MIATTLSIILLGLLFLLMAFGAALTIGGAYAFTIYKGRTRAATVLNALCAMVTVAGVAVFALAAILIAPLVLA